MTAFCFIVFPLHSSIHIYHDNMYQTHYIVMTPKYLYIVMIFPEFQAYISNCLSDMSTWILISLGKHSRVELLNNSDDVFFTSQEIQQSFPKQLYTSQTNYQCMRVSVIQHLLHYNVIHFPFSCLRRIKGIHFEILILISLLICY